ncbi:hypothetical protein EPUS_08205 [Endocarpon pusillum Z07020]|uniref:Uncharacterized protein n=1 Tax=Endocarpon pusillum (strain Z07020 / HMAS-L-300199) TaxID=1263415 RepID=U1HH38_ENDPU|nr:uncharacterized protein EPUS_08205 [Endocarpon pusillum Z07020]ERF68139.1 hypothetical protein EPUS_08205 [Endocarpon pusillum Z07020]
MPQKQRAVPKPRPKDSTAPSWSWASVFMRQTMAHVDWYRSEWWLTSDMFLRDAFEEAHCEPEATTTPFGKLKDAAYLRLDAVLYPWYLRSFCQMAERERGWNRRPGTKDLFIERPNHSTKCTMETQELTVDDANG